MALLGAVAASGAGGRRGCMLRVAADAITFYCSGAESGHANGTATKGSANDGESGGSNYYLRAVGGVVGVATGDDPSVAALDDDGGGGPRPGDYFRPIRSVSMTGYDFNTTAVTVLMNTTASIEPFVNGSNQTLIKGSDEDFTNYVFIITIGIILGAMILTTICGNALVIAAILLERNLQNVANYLIVSLAVADLMVACLVMPLGAVYEISRGWILGPELCDMWTSSDVLCCTASILHLVAIAVDRYWAVTNVDYIHTRNGRRIVGMIVVVWSVALIVSLAPQFGWKDPDYLDRINIQQQCMVSQDIGYQIFATCSTFYVPLLVILFLYWKIFKIARRRIRRRRAQRNAMLEHSKLKKPADETSTEPKKYGFFRKAVFLRIKKKKEVEETAVCSSIGLIDGHSSCSMPESSQDGQTKCGGEDKTTAFTISTNHDNCAAVTTVEDDGPTITDSVPIRHTVIEMNVNRMSLAAPRVKPKREKKESLEAKRERKAAKTLAIITGAFVVCWLPFFIMALVMPLCQHCHINKYVSSFFLWLGYFNSTLNPIIYTVFSPEFRLAFTKMICGTTYRR
ncbi:5-hydroxytryptamine receptor-like [Daktulosphaira vitifoliae]|uniref:5-hydroxytryptamine receptor-like n=1 Tax=Daktulosphaira vitifoliae TaxID=58002 RepID=UPI0021AA8763|nr:5-hydroxytryptamine receptor-like [Daktulosphaira vitifoliae]XP_050539546.1 5-hydroxytryptamine receptor-like [Daktulosphaira vitifoliae]